MRIYMCKRCCVLRGTRSRAEGDGRSAANQCCDMRADLATIGPETTLKARRCVGPMRAMRGLGVTIEWQRVKPSLLVGYLIVVPDDPF